MCRECAEEALPERAEACEHRPWEEAIAERWPLWRLPADDESVEVTRPDREQRRAA